MGMESEKLVINGEQKTLSTISYKPYTLGLQK